MCVHCKIHTQTETHLDAYTQIHLQTHKCTCTRLNKIIVTHHGARLRAHSDRLTHSLTFCYIHSFTH